MPTSGTFLQDVEDAIIAALAPLVYAGVNDEPDYGMVREPVRGFIIGADVEALTAIAAAKIPTPGAILTSPSLSIEYPLDSGFSTLPLTYRLIFATDRKGGDGLDQDQARKKDAFSFFDRAISALYQARLDLPSDVPLALKNAVQYVQLQEFGFANPAIDNPLTLFACSFVVPVTAFAGDCRS